MADAGDDDATRARLLADILANPDDDGPRLVFADWLVQRGDPRGEMISVQCLLEAATGGERARLVNRASVLLLRQGAWLREILDVVRGVETRRGFVWSINATADVFAERCAPLFAREPIHELRVIDPAPRDLATLASAPHLARLRSLVMLEPVVLGGDEDVELLGALLASPHLAGIRALDLRIAIEPAAEEGARGVIAGLALPALASLKLRAGTKFDPPRAAAIVAGLAKAALPSLTALTVRRNTLGALRAGFGGRVAIGEIGDYD